MAGRIAVVDDAEGGVTVEQVAVAIVDGAPSRLDAIERELLDASRQAAADAYERGAREALLAVVRSVRDVRHAEGLAAQTAPFEPGSLPARLLAEIAGGVRGANADLADRLDTDPTQLSRAGRRLRDLGLARRVRQGRLNQWELTPDGAVAAERLGG